MLFSERGETSLIHYAAIGDSLTSGVGDFFGGGFVPKYSRLIQETLQRQVVYDKMGVSGARSADILTMVNHDHSVRSALRSADIITITAGGNDLVDAAKAYASQHNSDVFRQTIARCNQNLSGILSVIRQLKSGSKPYLIRIVDLYNPSPSFPEADYWIKRFNARLEGFENSNLKVANVYAPFQGYESELLFLDRFHPNGRGYRVFAEVLHRQGYRPLA
jgi:lysophospholipase L1-like esterase